MPEPHLVKLVRLVFLQTVVASYLVHAGQMVLLK